MKVSEAARLRIRPHGTGDDALEITSGLNFQRVDHGVRSLADRDHEHAAVRMKIVKVFADPEHATFTANMPLESPINAGFTEGVFEKMPRRYSHLDSESFAIGRCRRHAGNYRG